MFRLVGLMVILGRLRVRGGRFRRLWTRLVLGIRCIFVGVRIMRKWFCRMCRDRLLVGLRFGRIILSMLLWMRVV